MGPVKWESFCHGGENEGDYGRLGGGKHGCLAIDQPMASQIHVERESSLSV